MSKFYIRKLLYLLPSVFLLSFLAFLLIHLCPGDPVERMLQSPGNEDEASASSIIHENEKVYWTHRLGLDLPLFYFSIHSLAEPDTIYKIRSLKERKALIALLRENGNTSEIMDYYVLWQNSLHYQNNNTIQQSESSRRIQTRLSSLFMLQSIEAQGKFLENLRTEADTDSTLSSSISGLIDKLKFAESHAIPSRKWIPVLNFHAKNQFHTFLFGDANGNHGIIRGDFGISYRTKQPVAALIGSRIGWTLFFTLTSVLLSFVISIPVALKSASRPGKSFDRNSSMFFTILYSLPGFWLATILMMLFCNPDVFNWLPASGVKPISGFSSESNFIHRVVLTLPYLILPTICYTYSSFAFVTRSIRANAIEVMEQDYIRTARAKGLDEKHILWKHVFRNCLLPIITMFSNVFPYAISGSVILETVFTLPGMGLTIYQSVDSLDYPVILAVFTISGMITILGFFLTDIVYARVDPRIHLEK